MQRKSVRSRKPSPKSRKPSPKSRKPSPKSRKPSPKSRKPSPKKLSKPKRPSEITVTVTAMTGKNYIVVFNNGTPTYCDIKDAVYQRILGDMKPPPLRRQLILADTEHRVIEDDSKPISESMKLDLLLEDPTWTRAQQYIIDDVFDEHKNYMHIERREDSPDKMEAFIWAMQRNSFIKILSIDNMTITPIMRALHETENIKELIINNITNNDDLIQFFHIIGQNKFIDKLIIEKTNFTGGMMDALVDVLSKNVSLHHINIGKCVIEAEDIKKLVRSTRLNLQLLELDDVTVSGQGKKNIKEFLKVPTLQSAAALDVLDNSGGIRVSEVKGCKIENWMWTQPDGMQDELWWIQHLRR